MFNPALFRGSLVGMIRVFDMNQQAIEAFVRFSDLVAVDFPLLCHFV